MIKNNNYNTLYYYYYYISVLFLSSYIVVCLNNMGVVVHFFFLHLSAVLTQADETPPAGSSSPPPQTSSVHTITDCSTLSCLPSPVPSVQHKQVKHHVISGNFRSSPVLDCISTLSAQTITEFKSSVCVRA